MTFQNNNLLIRITQLHANSAKKKNVPLVCLLFPERHNKTWIDHNTKIWLSCVLQRINNITVCMFTFVQCSDAFKINMKFFFDLHYAIRLGHLLVFFRLQIQLILYKRIES